MNWNTIQNREDVEEVHEMKIELLQPWSTFVMKTQLPSPVLNRMIKITDEIIENRINAYTPGAGQIKDQFTIDFDVLEKEGLLGFFNEACINFVIQQFCQSQPLTKENILKEEWMTRLNSIWINSQKPNEYFPIHRHANCDISAIMLLKIPEYLPSRRKYLINEKIGDVEEDGAITFTHNASLDKVWGVPNLQILPEVGDFFIFPATMLHQVYPFRTSDVEEERRSVSFNAVFSNKTQQEELKKQQEKTNE